MNKTHLTSYVIYLFIFLGVLAAFPPLVTDMYLPALPTMTTEFHASASAVQMGLSTCILGLAVGQLFFGPLSDKYGRKQLLKAAMALFVLASIVCIFSETIFIFNVARFFQGLGGAGGVVMSRSIATDCYSGKALAKTLAIIGAIHGVAPVVAPLVGGFFSELIGWQGIFTILLCVGVLVYLLILPFEESLPTDRRYRGELTSLFNHVRVLFRNSVYVRLVLVFGLCNGALFGYISSSSFILQSGFGLSQWAFGIVFGINSLGIAAGSFVSLRYRHLASAMRWGCIGMLFCAAGQFVNYAFNGGLWGFELMTVLMLFFLGKVFTASTTLAMTEGRQLTGWAAAILGTTGFLFGGLVIPLAGLGNIQLASFSVLAVCALLAIVISNTIISTLMHEQSPAQEEALEDAQSIMLQ